jgi:hypothetical protein
VFTFDSAEEWLKYMQWSHGLTWECSAPSHMPSVFTEQKDFHNHLIEAHDVPETQLEAPGKAGQRPPMEYIHDGPLRGRFHFNGRMTTVGVFANHAMETHVVTHPKEVAMIALPKLPIDDEKGSSAESAMSHKGDAGGRQPSMDSIMDDSSLEISEEPGEQRSCLFLLHNCPSHQSHAVE